MRARLERARARRWAIALAIAALTVTPGCSSSTKAPAKSQRMDVPRFSKRVDPGELLPADLDLVMRFDIERMRQALGPLVADQLAARAVEKRGDPMLRGLLACADVLWVGVRIVGIENGDHVAIIEGKDCEVRANTSDWKKTKSANGDLTIFDRISTTERSGTARVILAGDRSVVLVSPAEVASVDRVLHDGPDEKRREPKAEGIISLDLRAPRLPPELEKKYPSISSIIAGIDRVRATTELGDKGVDLEGEVLLKSPKDAERTLRFLKTLQDNVESDGARLVLASLHLEQVEATVRIRWTVPTKAVLALLDDAADQSGKTPATPGSP